jgi:outer membrane protein assembly factor BamB
VVSLSAHGGVAWERQLPTPRDLDGQALPVVDGSRVYVAAAGQVLALAAADGRVLWSASAPGTAYGLWVAGSRLVVALSQVGPGGRVLSFDLATGRPLWAYRIPGNGLLGDQLLLGDALAMVDAKGSTEVLDLATGKLRWQVAGRGQTYGLGTAAGVVARAIGGTLTGYSGQGGRVLWALRGLPEPAVVHGRGSTLVISAGATGPAISGDFTGVDALTGRKLWRVHDKAALDWGGGGPAGEVLYRSSSGSPQMLLVNTRTGRELWRARTQIALFLPAAVTAGTVTTIEGNTSIQRATRLVVRSAGTGRVLGSADVKGATYGPSRLSETATAVMLFQQTPPAPAVVSVAAYDNSGHRVWTAHLPRPTRALVPRPDGGAVALTVDPAYGCATTG